MADAHGALPLHVACASGAPPEVLRLVLGYNEEAITTPDATGQILLHACARSGAACTPATLGFLLQAYPAGCSVRDNAGRTALHAACACSDARLDAVTALTAAGGGSSAVTERDSDGATPLHLAAACGAPVSVVQHLLSLCPDAALIPDAGGALALHAAAEAGAHGQVVAALLQANPEGATLLVGGLRPLTAWLTTHADVAARDMEHLIPPLVALPDLAVRCVHELAAFPVAAPVLRAATDAHPTLPDALEPEPLTAPGPRLSALQVACQPCRAAMLTGGRLLRRFALSAVPAASTSDARLYLCDDAALPPGSYHRRVAVKVLRKKERHQRELGVRTTLGGVSCDSIMPVLHSFCATGPHPDPGFAEEAPLRGLWPQLLVMPRADASLAHALATRADCASARDWRAARMLTRSLAQCLQPFHAAGLVHGNLTPNHFLRCGDSLGGTWRLIHLDGCVSFHAGEFISDAVSPAYAPPELCRVDEDTQEVVLRTVAERGVLDAWEPGSLRAHVAYDMWALGCCLYQVFVGVPLWPQEDEAAGKEEHSLCETLTPEQLRRLAAWSEADLDKALEPLTSAATAVGSEAAAAAPVTEGAPLSPTKAAAETRTATSAANAAQLLRSLLHPLPQQRCASIDAVLAHPFTTPDHGGRRMSGWSIMDAASSMPAAAAPPSAPGSPVRAPAAAAPAEAPMSPSTWRGLSDSLLSAVNAFNLGLRTAAAAATEATSPSAQQHHAPAGGPPSFSIGPPPAAMVGPFPRTGLTRLGTAYPAAATAAADRLVRHAAVVPTDADAGSGMGSTYALGGEAGDTDVVSQTLTPVNTRVQPHGTVAATRSLVGVPAVLGGARAHGQPGSPSSAKSSEGGTPR